MWVHASVDLSYTFYFINNYYYVRARARRRSRDLTIARARFNFTLRNIRGTSEFFLHAITLCTYDYTMYKINKSDY